MSRFDMFRAKQAANSWEDSEGKMADKIAEPLIVKMKPGRNYYTRRQFNAIANYLLEPEGAERAIEKGKFHMGAIQVVFTPHLREDRLVSATSLAKITKTPERTLHRWLAAANLPFVAEGSEKLYELDTLFDLLTSPPDRAL